MHRIVNTIALLAAAVTLGAGIWQDWSLLSTLKRMVLSYLGFFFLGGVLAVSVLIIPHFERKEPGPRRETGESRKVMGK